MSLDKILNTLDEQGKLFHEFKRANDERLAKIEANAGVGEISEKLARMEAAFDKNEATVENLEKAISASKRPDFQSAPVDNKYLAAFKKFLVTGDDTEVRAFKAAVKVGTDVDGGFAVPENLDTQVDKLMLESSPMMQICGVKRFGPNYQKLVNVRGAVTANSAELAVISETDTSKLVKISTVYGKRVAAPVISEESLSDMFFDPESWVKEDVAEELMEEIETELVTGTGLLNTTKGFLAYPTASTADGTRAFGTIQYLATGVSAGFKALDAATGVNPADDLIDMQTALKEKHHAGALWLMNRSVKGTVRKMKDNDGNYIWQPRITLGELDVLLGYPLRTSHAMPAAAAGSLSVAFGDFNRAITLVIRPGIYVVRDNITQAPNLRFVFSKRYGLMLRNSEAIKLLKFSA